MKIFLALLPLALVGAAPAAPNWVGTVAQGPSGAYVMGNPAAKVRLVEYVSYTCSHCAHYVGEASVPMKRDYIAKGLIAVEVRNAVRDQFDMTAALAARCGGAAKFFGNTELLFATQNEWLGKAQAFVTANGPKLGKMAPEAGFKAILRGLGLDKILAKRGVSVAQLDVCLANKPNQQKILAMTNKAWNVDKIGGTPAFYVNDTQLSNAGIRHITCRIGAACRVFRRR
jgi:protein-disulfide isomerase